MSALPLLAFVLIILLADDWRALERRLLRSLQKFLARSLKCRHKSSPISVYKFCDILHLKSGKDIVFIYFWQLVLQEGSPLLLHSTYSWSAAFLVKSKIHCLICLIHHRIWIKPCHLQICSSSPSSTCNVKLPLQAILHKMNKFWFSPLSSRFHQDTVTATLDTSGW